MAEQMTTTWNGALSHAVTGNARVDLFYAASRDIEHARLLHLLKASWKESKLDTLKIAAYCRDVRGGKGERTLGRQMITWLAQHASAEIKHNLHYFIGVYGRWDDVLALFGTPLEDAGVELWASQLKEDMILLQDADKARLSLAAKWIPSENKAADKAYGVCKKLIKKLGLRNQADLRKNYLSPLRKQLDLLERLMCAKEWDAIQFSKVPSVAMKVHGGKGKAFQRNAGERFEAFKQALAKGKAKVNAKDLFPHQVVEQYLAGGSAPDELLEAQWRVMLGKGPALGDLSSVLVMSDVSGSMSGLPMCISIALGILVSQLTSDAWKGLVMTFETTPRFHTVTGDTLFEQVESLRYAPWGGSTNFQAALELILETALRHSLEQSAMPKRLIVVSDMQFDMAKGGSGTNYDTLRRKYDMAGYEVPHLVFWNVNGATSDFPATASTPNVSLISGYSAEVLKCVLQGVKVSPFTTMMNAISDARYNLITLPDPTE
ncbi:hypothetical protein BC830DRAFT_1068761 [Chytriomyces sp. MP71]|nr:hypothetical protein BC830DRAFT_1068761 [Chytriomyces sp. MP71]